LKPYAAFAKQLGETYIGLNKLPIYVQALTVIFNLSRTRDKRGQSLRETMTEIWVQNTREEAEKKTAETIAPYLADKKFVAAIGGRRRPRLIAQL